MGDGLPKLLSGDAFYEKVVEFTRWQQEEASKKAEKGEGRKAYKSAIEEWEKKEADRKKAVDAQQVRYHAATEEWQAARDAAKAAGTSKSFKTPKPKLGTLPKALPKPTLKAIMQQGIVDDDDEEEFIDLNTDDGSDNSD